MFVWLLNTPLINYHSVLTLKSMVSFKLLPFDFSLGSQSWLKQYTAKQKMISEDIITDTVKRICRNFNSFNFQQFSIFITGNIEYLQVLVLQRKFCQLQVNSLVMASLCIYYKLKIIANESCEVWLVNPPKLSNCQSPKKSFVFNVLISCHDRFKATRKRNQLDRLLWKFKWYEISSSGPIMF